MWCGRVCKVCSDLLSSSIEMASSTDPARARHDVSYATTSFAISLYNTLKQNGQNLFFSPLSISTAFSMTALGARENTLTQMKEVLQFGDLEAEQVHVWFSELHRALNEPDAPYLLRMANRMFARKDHALLDGFVSDTSKFYQAKSVPSDFASNSEAVRLEINKWVEEETAMKIRDLMPVGSIDRQTALVLVNAVYFKGSWLLPFDQCQTKRMPFYINATTKTEVDMMSVTADMRIGTSSELDADLLEMPYVGDQLSMVLILPRESSDLAKVESTITVAHLNKISETIGEEEVQAFIPKFKLEYSCSLHEALPSMGMADLFTEGKADLSGIDGTKDLYVSAAVHKAFLEVNEEGSEAAAATGYTWHQMCLPPEPRIFKADRPFLFFIREKQTSAVLFMGSLSSPTE